MLFFEVVWVDVLRQCRNRPYTQPALFAMPVAFLLFIGSKTDSTAHGKTIWKVLTTSGCVQTGAGFGAASRPTTKRQSLQKKALVGTRFFRSALPISAGGSG